MDKERYQKGKEIARQQAIEYQTDFAFKSMSYQHVAYWTEWFEYLGKRYGLLKEFRENGII